MHRRVVAFAIRIPVSVFRRINKISSSKRSSRQKVLPAVSMAEQVLDFHQPRSCRTSWWYHRTGKQAGIGSIFTLYVPVENMAVVTSKEVVETINTYQQMQVGADTGDIDTLLNSIRLSENAESRNMEIVNEMINETGDDRSHISGSDKVVLIVEDDLRFAKILIDKAP